MSNRVFRVLHLNARSVPIRHSGLHAQLRSAKFEQRDHLVVPVIGLVEGVLHAVNAPEPELVLASEFGISPGGWGGRPVTWDHPSMNGERVMANDPRTLERYSVGQVFNPRMHEDGKQLLLEAWLDGMKDHLPEARTLRDRLKTNETVEVSVGVFCTAEKAEGTYNGRKYNAIWRNIVPDHLAMLPRGSVGACSVEDGCGAPRTARKSFIIAASGGYDEAPQEQENKVTKCAKCGTEHEGDCVENRTLRQRLSALLFAGKKKPEDLTSKNLHSDLELVLRSSEPGFLGVDDVNLTTSEVMYSVAPDPDKVQHYQRGYSVGEDNAVALANKKTEVAPVLRWEPVVAEGQPRANCGCGGGAQHEGEPMKIATDRVKALIAKKTNAFTDTDISFLEGLPEDRFKALESFEPEVVEKVVEKEVVKEVVATPKTEEEYLASAPDSIRTIVTEHKAAQAAKRTAAVSRLKTAQSAFTEADLNAMPIDQLLKLDQAIPRPRGEVVDFSVRTAGENRQSNDAVDAPPSLTEAVGKARTAQGLK